MKRTSLAAALPVVLLLLGSLAACTQKTGEGDEETDTSSDKLSTETVELRLSSFHLKSWAEFGGSPSPRTVRWKRTSHCGRLFLCPSPNPGSSSPTYCATVPSGGAMTTSTSAFYLDLMYQTEDGHSCSSTDGPPDPEAPGAIDAHGFATVTTGEPSPPVAPPPPPPTSGSTSSACPFGGIPVTVGTNTVLESAAPDGPHAWVYYRLDVAAGNPAYLGNTPWWKQPSTDFLTFKLCADKQCTNVLSKQNHSKHMEFKELTISTTNGAAGVPLYLTASSMSGKPIQMCYKVGARRNDKCACR